MVLNFFLSLINTDITEFYSGLSSRNRFLSLIIVVALVESGFLYSPVDDYNGLLLVDLRLLVM